MVLAMQSTDFEISRLRGGDRLISREKRLFSARPGSLDVTARLTDVRIGTPRLMSHAADAPCAMRAATAVHTKNTVRAMAVIAQTDARDGAVRARVRVDWMWIIHSGGCDRAQWNDDRAWCGMRAWRARGVARV